jgi:signal transduction histidine kinase
MTPRRSLPSRTSRACGRCGGLAAENARLRAALAQQHAELRAACARIVEAGDAERRRLERNLHDGAQQRLVTAAVHLRLLARRLAPDPESDQMLARAQEELAGSHQELRELARGLHPAELTTWGLVPALENLAVRAHLQVALVDNLRGRLDATIEAAAYYVASEALANTAKHAEASSARVTLSEAEDVVVVEVADDGIGGADAANGSGLLGLADRVHALGGHLDVFSGAGAGTTIRAELPVCARRTVAF